MLCNVKLSLNTFIFPSVGKVLHWKVTITLEGNWWGLQLSISTACVNACAEDCLKPQVHGVWLAALFDYAQPPPPISDDHFYFRCHDLVSRQFSIDLGSEVISCNCISVYKHLIANVYCAVIIICVSWSSKYNKYNAGYSDDSKYCISRSSKQKNDCENKNINSCYYCNQNGGWWPDT